MEECLRCGETGEHLLDVAADTDPDTVVAKLCVDCEDDLVWSGVEVGPAGTCGYSDNCNRTAEYVTLETETNANTDEGGNALAQKRNNVLCTQHFDELRS